MRYPTIVRRSCFQKSHCSVPCAKITSDGWRFVSGPSATAAAGWCPSAAVNSMHLLFFVLSRGSPYSGLIALIMPDVLLSVKRSRKTTTQQSVPCTVTKRPTGKTVLQDCGRRTGKSSAARHCRITSRSCSAKQYNSAGKFPNARWSRSSLFLSWRTGWRREYSGVQLWNGIFSMPVLGRNTCALTKRPGKVLPDGSASRTG